MQYVNPVLQARTYFIEHESLTNHEQDIYWICGNSQIGKNFLLNFLLQHRMGMVKKRFLFALLARFLRSPILHYADSLWIKKK